MCTKRILFLRHGQAKHNPRAELAKSKGCSHEQFLDLMRQDDVFDAPLTDIGEEQARKGAEIFGRRLRDVDLVVSSPLSRAIQTADLVVPPHDIFNTGGVRQPKRVCVEDYREINGWLLNAKRPDRADFESLFHPSWDFSSLTDTDQTWSETLELESDAAERGYQGLQWLAQCKEKNILVVCHGGLLRFFMNDHPNIQVSDGRTNSSREFRSVKARFGNCELREYDMHWSEDEQILKKSPAPKPEVSSSQHHIHTMAKGLTAEQQKLCPNFILEEV